MKKITVFLLASFFLLSAKAESGVLECKTSLKVLVSDYWKTTNIRDYKNAGNQTLLIFLADKSLTIDGMKLETIKHRFKSDDGYEEYGDFNKTETTYEAFKFTEKGVEGSGYYLSHIRLSIDRLNGDVYYTKSSYIHDLKNSPFQKFNFLNIKSGFVNSIYEGKCSPSKQKRLF